MLTLLFLIVEVFLLEIISKLNLLIEPALGFKTLTFLTLGDSFKSNTILDVLALKSAYLIPLITPVACGNEKSLLNLTLYKSTTILEGLVNAEISCFIKSVSYTHLTLPTKRIV